jgi:hypothetical protein
MSRQIFISYTRDDEQFAKHLADTLCETGANVWLDIYNARPGRHWARSIEQALAESKMMIVVLSPAALESAHIAVEWQAYLEEIHPCTENRYTPYGSPVHPPVPEIDTYKQTSFSNKQEMSNLENLWNAVLATLKLQLLSTTFIAFIEDTRLLAIDNAIATVELANPSAKDWVEQRLSRQLKHLLFIEGKIFIPEMQPVKELVIVTREEGSSP